jgi:hypothetical protein
MRADLIKRLTILEKGSLPEIPPFYVPGYDDDDQIGLVWAGWVLDGEPDSWHVNSGTEPPPELIMLLQKYPYLKTEAPK